MTPEVRTNTRGLEVKKDAFLVIEVPRRGFSGHKESSCLSLVQG